MISVHYYARSLNVCLELYTAYMASSWTEEEVLQWLDKSGLSEVKDKFRGKVWNLNTLFFCVVLIVAFMGQVCHLCGLYKPSIKKLLQHYSLCHQSDPNFNAKCSLCHLCYKSVSSLRVHYYRKHRADIDVRCQVEDKDNQDSVSVVSSTGNEDTEDKNKKNKAL